jgi:hypothetical protein
MSYTQSQVTFYCILLNVRHIKKVSNKAVSLNELDTLRSVMSAAEKLDKIGLDFMQNRCYE